MSKKEIKVGKQVLREDELTFPVEYEGEIFTLKYPSPFEKSAIEVDIANRLGGFPRNSFTSDHVLMVTATAYVHNIIVREKSPDWFTSAWTCYDENCIGTLYQGYLEFRNKFPKRIRADGLERDSKGGES